MSTLLMSYAQVVSEGQALVDILQYQDQRHRPHGPQPELPDRQSIQRGQECLRRPKWPERSDREAQPYDCVTPQR